MSILINATVQYNAFNYKIELYIGLTIIGIKKRYFLEFIHICTV
jgi:hypothetical protein